MVSEDGVCAALMDHTAVIRVVPLDEPNEAVDRRPQPALTPLVDRRIMRARSDHGGSPMNRSRQAGAVLV
jgi:hypothetical protein